jgi:glutathione synthase/RimK-type ligase-like ATP-grasp enzyme
MNKILILNYTNSGENKEFANLFKEKLADICQVYSCDFSDTSVFVKKDGIEVMFGDHNAKEFDLIYFRRVGHVYFKLAAALALCIKNLGIKFFDTGLSDIGPAGNKFISFLRLYFSGLPVITPTYFCPKETILQKYHEICKEIGLPLVFKHLHLQRGSGVFLIKEASQIPEILKKFPSGDFMFQKLVNNVHEYRVLVLNGKIGAYEEKVKTDKNEFRGNVHLGALEKFFDVDSIPSDIKEISIKAAKVLGIEVAGVDVVTDDNDKAWLIEVNRGPGLTYNEKISPEIANFAKFLREELEEK